MANRSFDLNDKPHEATIGGHVIYFMPEVTGPFFAKAYAKLNDVQRRVSAMAGGKASSTKHAKAEELDPSALIEVSEGLSEFIGRFVMDKSKDKWAGLVEDGLPDRLYGDLVEWIAEIYGAGSGNPDAAGGTSTG